MTGRYIAQVNFQAKTGLAKDRFVNTFHFIGSGTDVGADCLDIALRLSEFYFKPIAGDPSLHAYMPASIEPVVILNIYDFDTPKPRVPYTFHLNSGAGASTDAALPEEIALCLSFYSTRNTPTTRNRIYFGPLNVFALGGPGTVTSRPVPTLITALTGAAARLAVTDSGGAVNASNWVIDGLFLAGLAGLPGAPSMPSFLLPQNFPAAQPTSWVVHSPIGTGTRLAPDPMWGFVTGGWVDNEWDGQDRRRVDASARVTFAA